MASNDQLAYAIIDRVTDKQEGGWKLSKDADGGDGGWTFGGVTKRLYDATMIGVHDGFVGMTYEDIEKEALLDSDKFKRFKLDCIKIYKFVFWDKLHLDNFLPAHWEMVYSCAINCDIKPTVELMQRVVGAKEDGSWGEASQRAYTTCSNIFKDAFLREWTRHYIRICVHNPVKLQFLEGWFNRVESFR